VAESENVNKELFRALSISVGVTDDNRQSRKPRLYVHSESNGKKFLTNMFTPRPANCAFLMPIGTASVLFCFQILHLRVRELINLQISRCFPQCRGQMAVMVATQYRRWREQSREERSLHSRCGVSLQHGNEPCKQ
jgi:hypothetical protein